MKRFREKTENEEGAALIEFALVLPILLTLVLGIAEFGFALATELDVRHGAREGSRLVAVGTPDINRVCDAMTFDNGVVVTFTGGGDVGDPATTTVTAPAVTLTGFFGWIPGWPLPLSGEVQSRIEQVSTTGYPSGTCP